ncbi:MAG: ABC transporter ATP-binding protein [Eggerthellaceae bacterium]|nr:ABC transporter ATP-binding protein [Eggerthellaceae bacterium]MDR2715574.1 ABC transporter ATP-binding protein [Coriobacteriaceae bacterium]
MARQTVRHTPQPVGPKEADRTHVPGIDGTVLPVAVTVRDVSYTYTKKPFIEGLDLDFARSKITSIVGPNGCGKSTLLKIVDGLIEPHTGEVAINGRPSLGMSGKERARHLALLAQGARPPAMTVEALVACGRYPYQGRMRSHLDAEDRLHVEEAMARAGIEHFRNHDVRRLSGGERQRAFIAMTLAQDTGIIALDEPTTYLDVRACHDIMQLVCELNRDAGKTIVMVIHDLDLALRYSDHMMVMEKGRCICADSVDAVLATGAIEQAFQVEVCRFPSDDRTAYTLFPF